MLQWLARGRNEPVESEWGELRNRPVGIIDIGSNSVRLVVYEGEVRTPLPLFNEKAICALGKGMQESGRLNPEGVDPALNAIARYVKLAEAMGVARLDVMATAAVRDAEDGPWFVSELEHRTGVKVQLCSGAEEAELAALGVLCSVPDADGLVADMGGGSLELVTVGQGSVGNFITMPLGVLRLEEATGGKPDKAPQIIDPFLDDIPWLEEGRGKSLYAVGGAWRAVARIMIEQRNYPLHVLDNYVISTMEAIDLLEVISHLGPKSLDQIPNVSKRRMGNIPYAAAALERLLMRIMPSRLVFSVYGMREGNFFRRLPEEIRKQDPLIAAALHMARAAGRFPEHADELMAWLAPLFVEDGPRRWRLRYAACLMSDTFWNEHADYRAEQAFMEVFRLPFMGLEHRDRAGLALAVYYRYTSSKSWEMVTKAEELLSEGRRVQVETLGLALRLAHTISGGAPHLLRRTSLRVKDGKLTLTLPKGDPTYDPDAFQRRLDRLAKNLSLEPEIAWDDEDSAL